MSIDSAKPILSPRVKYGFSSNMVCNASSCVGVGRLRVWISVVVSDPAESVEAVVAELRTEIDDKLRARAGIVVGEPVEDGCIGVLRP
jgi:hypothetical protein